jgi:hypothetical protein
LGEVRDDDKRVPLDDTCGHALFAVRWHPRVPAKRYLPANQIDSCSKHLHIGIPECLRLFFSVNFQIVAFYLFKVKNQNAQRA